MRTCWSWKLKSFRKLMHFENEKKFISRFPFPDHRWKLSFARVRNVKQTKYFSRHSNTWAGFVRPFLLLRAVTAGIFEMDFWRICWQTLYFFCLVHVGNHKTQSFKWQSVKIGKFYSSCNRGCHGGNCSCITGAEDLKRQKKINAGRRSEIFLNWWKHFYTGSSMLKITITSQ